jgi:hypothetical protein
MLSRWAAYMANRNHIGVSAIDHRRHARQPRQTPACGFQP